MDCTTDLLQSPTQIETGASCFETKEDRVRNVLSHVFVFSFAALVVFYCASRFSIFDFGTERMRLEFYLEINGNGRRGVGPKSLKRRAGDGDRTRDVQLGKLDVD